MRTYYSVDYAVYTNDDGNQGAKLYLFRRLPLPLQVVEFAVDLVGLVVHSLTARRPGWYFSLHLWLNSKRFGRCFPVELAATDENLGKLERQLSEDAVRWP